MCSQMALFFLDTFIDGAVFTIISLCFMGGAGQGVLSTCITKHAIILIPYLHQKHSPNLLVNSSLST